LAAKWRRVSTGQVATLPIGDTISKFLTPLAETLLPTTYRLAAYFLLTVLDDPAMVAMAFC
jgi:hypothetical protein